MSTELMSLWKIEDELTALLDTVEACPDELKPEIEAAIDEYLGREAAKVDSIAHVLAALDYEQKAAADEISRLQERKKAAKASQERLEQYVCRVIAMRGSKLIGKTNTLIVRPSEAVKITNEQAIPDEYCETVIEMNTGQFRAVQERLADLGAVWSMKPCKDPIKRALKKGVSVPGAELETRQNLQRK